MKKLLVFSVVLALILTLVLPSVAMAAKPDVFNATGVMTSIDQGNSTQIGTTSLWTVTDRHIQGKFLKGDIGKANKVNGSFMVTYGGTFDISDQSGDFTGKLEAKSATLSISGNTSPYQYYGPSQIPNVPLLKIYITGTWVGVQGLKDDGSFNAWMVFLPTADGHVAAIVDSYFNINGEYPQ